MSATRATRRRAASASRRSAARKAALKRSAKPAARAAVVPAMVMYRVCRPGWAVLVEKQANALGTRFVCPFCPVSHRVPGPVRGFRKMRRAQWIKLRRVGE